MTTSRSAKTQRTARAIAVALSLLCVIGATLHSATAAPPISTVAATSTLSPAESLPPLTASLVASATAVPAGGTFGYSADIRLDQPASYLEVRFQIRRPSGFLVYQRTQVANDLESGLKRFSFERALEGLDLKPGVYPIEIAVRADVGGSTVTTDLAADLLVYDPAAEKQPVALVVRVNGQPLAGPDGTFALDPAIALRARDEVSRISTLVTADPNARVTLGVPPVLLSEWRRISGGYTMNDGREVPASDPVATSYGTALGELKTAIDTGRLELVSLGYADPDLNDLGDQGLGGDTSPQYEAGLSAIFASLETTPSTGTVPAGGCVPPRAVELLAGAGVGYVVTDSDCGRAVTGTATSGAYRIPGSPVVALLVDNEASTNLSSSEPSTAVRGAFDRLNGGKKQPYVVRIDLGESTADATSTVGGALSALEAAPWVSMITARDAAGGTNLPKVRLIAGEQAPAAPAGFWDDVAKARAYSSAMIASLGVGDAEANTAQMQSLVAESSAWAGPAGTWQFAERGRAFALSSLKISRTMLDTVRIKIEPITLSGAKGDVPVSVLNGTQKTLNVVIRTTTSGGIMVKGARNINTVLRPQETFVQIPVDLKSSLSGKLTVEVAAGDLVLSRKTVDVKASYLDRLAMIGGIVILLGILLAFIVRRVRAAEAAANKDDGDTPGTSERYTGDSAPPRDEAEE